MNDKEILEKITEYIPSGINTKTRKIIDEKLSQLLASYEKQFEEIRDFIGMDRNKEQRELHQKFLKEPTPQKECEHKFITGEVGCLLCGKFKSEINLKKDIPTGDAYGICDCPEKCQLHPQKTDWADILHTIKRYTHDRSESGYDDIMGVCGNPCYQCQKDKRMVDELKEKLANLLSEKQQETREEIGREFREWFRSGQAGNESIGKFIERILGIKI